MSSNCCFGSLTAPIPDDRRIFAGLAGGRQNFADELIVRLVFIERLANPIVEQKIAMLVVRHHPLVAQDRQLHFVAK